MGSIGGFGPLSLLHTPSFLPLSQPDSLASFARFPAFEGGSGRVGSGSAGDLLTAGRFPHRIHAEFQLSEPPDFPFWFSPGQFTGHIILSKDSTHVRDFRLFVPNHR